MDSLINNLPQQEDAFLCIVDQSYPSEGNVCTKTQISSAKAKGWNVYARNGYDDVEYEGSDPVENDIIINDENFPDEVFRAFLKEQTYGEDGIITEDEINTITTINIRNIKSLEGIEFFTRLNTLVCNFCQFTSLDLSKNSALTYLNCGHNQLTSLDVSNNTALTELYCYGNNLSELNLSNNTALTSLHCGNNKLKKLDVSKNTELTSLTCSINELTELDVTNNIALNVLDCYENKLTYLDVSHNTELKELICNVNVITNLDLSKNTALTTLLCKDNQLASLDVTNNEELTVLCCTGNLLTNLDVANNRKLTTLECARNRLTELDITKNYQLSSLACYSNKIKGSDMDALIDGLPIKENAILYIICTGDNLEENICNTTQVDKAKQKGWRVVNGGDTYIYSYHGYNVGFNDYEGSDPLIQLTNGDFEIWEDGLPTGWKSASTASSATLTQSTDAHSGSYSVNVNGDEMQNKRLASQEITLEPGSYIFSFYAKATTTEVCQIGPGYVPIVDGRAQTYHYGNYINLNNTEWTQVNYEFTLAEETTVCLVVTKPKKSNYSSGKAVLIDDATLSAGSLSCITPVSIDNLIISSIHTLEGKRINKPQKGINIINGKKVVVK
jgi:hypothetical protein